MEGLIIKCPHCNKKIIVKLHDDGDHTVVFFDEKISQEQAFEEFGICLGLKGGETK